MTNCWKRQWIKARVWMAISRGLFFYLCVCFVTRLSQICCIWAAGDALFGSVLAACWCVGACGCWCEEAACARTSATSPPTWTRKISCWAHNFCFCGALDPRGPTAATCLQLNNTLTRLNAPCNACDCMLVSTWWAGIIDCHARFCSKPADCRWLGTSLLWK